LPCPPSAEPEGLRLRPVVDKQYASPVSVFLVAIDPGAQLSSEAVTFLCLSDAAFVFSIATVSISKNIVIGKINFFIRVFSPLFYIMTLFLID